MPPGPPTPKSWKYKGSSKTSGYPRPARPSTGGVGNIRYLPPPDNPAIRDYLPPPGGVTAPPSATTPASTGVYVPPKPPNPLTWKVGYSIPGSPDWWKGLVANKINPDTAYIMAATSWLPYLSPEDQRAFVSNLQRQIQFGKGKGASFGDTTGFGFGITPAVTSDVSQFYLSPQRAEGAITALERMRQAAGFNVKKFGAGFEYLRQVADVLRDYSAYNRPMSRAEYAAFTAAIDPLLNEGKNNSALAPYTALATAFLNPFLTAGSLMPMRKLPSGAPAFGAPNPQLFT